MPATNVHRSKSAIVVDRLSELWPIRKLKAYKANARTHTPTQIAQVVASIREFGWTNPILAKPDGTVIAGHARLQAARECGLEEVPVIVLNGLSDAQCRALVIADNQLALNAGWDEELLKLEIASLKADEFNLDILGFEPEALKKLVVFEASDEPAADPDEVPAPPADAITKPGDLWLLGRHRLLCGDSRDAAAFQRLMDGDRAAVLWTDPPYGVSYVGKTKDELTIENDGAEDLPELLEAVFANCARALAPASPFYIAHPAGPLCLVFGNVLVKLGWRIHEDLVWVKDSMVLGHSDYHYRHEPIYYGYTPGNGRPGRGRHEGSRWFGGNDQTSVFEYPRPKASTEHPTMKPVELIQHHLNNSSARGTIVLEPFNGSGSTLIASEATGRVCYAMEISATFCDVTVRRWEAVTGEKARLAAA